MVFIYKQDLHYYYFYYHFSDFLKINKTLIYNYIQEVETDLDKDRIKSVVSELMVEAQAVEIA